MIEEQANLERLEHPVMSTAIGVARIGSAYRVIAHEPIPAGAWILDLTGRLTCYSSRTTVQVDETLHVELPEAADLERDLDRHPWRFLNHACEPSATFVGFRLRALRDLQPWDEVTFDYETTEWELAEPFSCRCGSPGCGGREVRGFRYLPPAERAARRDRLAAHLLRRIAES